MPISNRRDFVKSLGVGGAIALAGCGGTGDGADGDGDGTGDGTGDGSGDGTGGDGGADLEPLPPVEWLTLSREDNPTYFEEAQQAQRMLEDLGFEFNESVHEVGQWVNTLFAKDYDMANIGWSNTVERLFPYYNLYFSFHSSFTGEGGGNFMEWGRPEYDEAVEEFTRSMDLEQRVDAAHRAQAIIAENAPIAFMTNPSVFVTHNHELYDGWERMLGRFAYFNPTSLKTAVRQSGDPVVVSASVSPPEQFPNFMSHTGPVAVFLHKLNYDPLIQMDTQGNPIPEGAAEDWEVVDDQTIDVTLRDGMTWHDGEPVTPEDVKFTWDYATDHGIAYLASDIAPYESSELMGDRTVRFHLNQPFAGFIPVSMYRLPLLPQHVWDGITEEEDLDHPGQWANPDTTGSGPFEMVNYEPGNRIVFEKHDDHYAADEYDFDTFVYNIYGSRTAAVGDVIQGNAAFAEDVGFSDWERADEADSTTADTNPSIRVNGIFMNTIREPFNDVRVRQAVAYAINRQEIIDTVHQGHGEPATSPIAPANETYYNPDVRTYEHDLNQARSLLEEAGLQVQDGTIMKPTDWEPTVEYVSPNG